MRNIALSLTAPLLIAAFASGTRAEEPTASKPDAPVPVPCEEPDFAFFASMPYTEKAGSPAFTWVTSVGVQREAEPEGKRSARNVQTGIRAEVGITDDLTVGA